MKYFFSLLFILFFSFSARAVDCPADKPLKGTDGVCYSCDEIKPVSTYYKTSHGEEDAFNDYEEGKYCERICPNRFAMPFGWLDMQSETCYLDTLWGHTRNFYIYNPVLYINLLFFWLVLQKIISIIFQKKDKKLPRNINVMGRIICIILATTLSVGLLEISRGFFALVPYILSFVFALYGVFRLAKRKSRHF